MKQFKKLWLVGLSLLAIPLMMLVAQPNSAYAEKVNYAVTPIYPANQTDPNLGYYDLKVKPGQKQTVSIAVQNSGSKAAQVDVTPTTATTNDSGLMNYQPSDAKKDSTLKYAFSDLMSGSQRVTIPANGSQTVTFTLQAPKATFAGKISGGFYVSEVADDSVTKSLSGKGATLTNRYAYVVGVVLRQDGQPTVKPSLRLQTVKPGLVNAHTAIIANLQNTRAESLGEMDVKAEIRKVGQSKVLYQNHQQGLQMAPNSNFNYGINLKNKPLKAGRYQLKMTIKGNKGSWVLTKEFTITRQQANKYNDKAVELPKTNWWPYIIIGLLAVIILFLIWLLWKRRKNDKDEPAK